MRSTWHTVLRGLRSGMYGAAFGLVWGVGVCVYFFFKSTDMPTTHLPPLWMVFIWFVLPGIISGWCSEALFLVKPLRGQAKGLAWGQVAIGIAVAVYPGPYLALFGGYLGSFTIAIPLAWAAPWLGNLALFPGMCIGSSLALLIVEFFSMSVPVVMVQGLRSAANGVRTRLHPA